MLPIGEINDTDWLKQMAKTETDKYIFGLRVSWTREKTDESKVRYIKKRSYYWSYPHIPAFKSYWYYYQTIKPMTLEEVVKFISEIWDDSITKDYDTNFRYICEIVSKEDE